MNSASDTHSAPFVSVCIVTYNHKDHIRNCIHGALNQKTDFPVEIIIGEDESSDGTREICRELRAQHPDRIQLHLRSRSDNIRIFGKPTGRFNFIETLKAAKGKYIAICEGDDYWTNEEKLSHQVRVLEENPSVNLCYHNVQHRHEDGSITYDRFNSMEKPERFAFRNSLLGKNGTTMSILFRREAVDFDQLMKSSLQSAMGDWPLEVLLTIDGDGIRLPDTYGIRNILHAGATNTRLQDNVYFPSRNNFLVQIEDSLTPGKQLMVLDFRLNLYVRRVVNNIKSASFANLPKDLRAIRKIKKNMRSLHPSSDYHEIDYGNAHYGVKILF